MAKRREEEMVREKILYGIAGEVYKLYEVG